MSTDLLEQELHQELDSGDWRRADETYPELVEKAKERTVSFIGGIAVEKMVSVEELSNETTLLSATQEARFGDDRARNLVYMSVSTDLSERMFKSKNETKVFMDIVNNRLMQNGRPNVEVLGNTFRYSRLNDTMHDQAIAEQTNAFLFDIFIEQGILDTHDVLVASATPTDEHTREKYNFFTETDTMSLQLLSKEGSVASLHSAFVAGKVSPNAPRHDLRAIKKVAIDNNVDLNDYSEEQLVRYVILIPKGSLKNGVTSVVEQFDKAAGGTFYGEREEPQDYAEFSDMCLRRDFSAIASGITDQLIAESYLMKTPMDAVRRLNKLSGATAVRYAVVNDDIDERIFGSEAAPIIKDARKALKEGRYEYVDSLVNSAIKVETSTSCPFDPEKMSSGEDKYGSREFSCPHCNSKNIRPYNMLIENCQTCGLDVRC